jgi:ATP-dependent protease ClpP protease subunit
MKKRRPLIPRTPNLRPRRDEDDSEGYSAVLGKDLIYHGEVGPKLACFLWENVLRSKCRLIDSEAGAAKEGRRLFLNSGGGSVYDMLSIIDLFEEAWDLATVATGTCMSAAVPIVAAGTPGKRFATWRTRFMLHPGWDCFEDPIEMEPLKAELEQFKESEILYNEIMARYCNNSTAWWNKKLTNHVPWYFGPEEALALGIIDHIIPDKLTEQKRPRRARKKKSS